MSLLIRGFCILVLLVPVVSTGQPTANFSASSTQGCSPLVVNFTDLSTGGVIQWWWTFGNGGTSDTSHPTATYLNPGTYDVTLIVFNGTTYDTLVQSNYITVFKNPQPNFSGTPLAGCQPLTVSFTDLTVLGDAPLVSWLWDFGDGNTAGVKNPTSMYAAGLFTVSLQVSDANGCSGIHIKQQYVNVTAAPVASFTADPTYTCDADGSITFTNTSTGAAPLTYQWDFGDGNTSTAFEPTHAYGGYASYTVRLIVTDVNGCTDTLIRPNYANVIEHMTEMFVDKNEGCLMPFSDTFHFVDLSGPVVAYRLWDFGDGTFSSQKSPVHFYSASGIYPVKLITGGPGCLDTVYDTIRVHQVYAAYSDSAFLCELTYGFTDLSFNATTWLWDFGDGTISTEQHPTHTYASEAPPSYSVKLTVTNPAGCTDQVSTLNVFPDTSEHEIIPSGLISGCAPLTVPFRDTMIGSSQVVSWHWDFGTGDTSNQPNPNYTYADTGKYLVTLSVVTSEGCELTTVVWVTVGNEPLADFIPLDSVVCPGDTVLFHLTKQLASVMIIEFGDGPVGSYVFSGSDTLIHHVYRFPGFYTPKLTYHHNGCGDTTIQSLLSVLVKGPLARFTIDPFDCSNPFNVSFRDSSLPDPQYWKWYFGDGDSSDLQHPSHTYSDRGTYDITLVVWNDSTGCETSMTRPHIVSVPEAVFTVSDTFGCNHILGVVFDGTQTIDASPYCWDFGNGVHYGCGAAADPNYPVPTPPPQSYSYPNTFYPSLVVLDAHGCSDTLTKTINAVKHVTMINTPVNACAGVPHSFEDATVSDTTITSWSWNFGDGDTSALQHPTHTFAGGSQYPVTLQTTDANGCYGSALHLVQVFEPIAQFNASKTAGCAGESIWFNNSSFGALISWQWDFGNGDTSMEHSPTYAYDSAGVYTVTLIVTDTAGCSDTLIRANYINLAQPTAAFSASPMTAPCPPVLVAFTDQSVGDISQWEWDFGDGSGSGAKNPQHNYTEPGDYVITLVVTSVAGCKDTLVIPAFIQIGGPSAEFHVEPLAGCKPLAVTFWLTNKQDVAEVFWDFGDGITSGADSVTHVFTNGGTYTPILIISNGLTGNDECEKEFTLPQITVHSVTADFVASPPAGCVPQTISFANASSSNTTSWSWTFGNGNTASGSTPSPQSYTTPGTYTVTLAVLSTEGCEDSISKSIVIHDLPQVMAWADTFICEGGQAFINSTNVSGWSYEWHPSGTGQTNSVTVSPTGPTSYFVVVTDANGCVDSSGTVTVTIQTMPSIMAWPDTVILLADSAQIHFSADQTVTNISWAPDYNITCMDCPDPIVFPRTTTEYKVTAFDTVGCFELTAYVLIEVIEDLTIAVPDAFTPNGDGVNDLIQVRGWGIEELLTWRIYNRWGEMVFETTDLHQGWDGVYRGQTQNADTYSWYAKARSYNGLVKEEKGSFSLVR